VTSLHEILGSAAGETGERERAFESRTAEWVEWGIQTEASSRFFWNGGTGFWAFVVFGGYVFRGSRGKGVVL